MLPQVVSYHTHIPHYIPQYTWDGLVEPMWKIIRFCTLMADLTLVPSNSMKVGKPIMGLPCIITGRVAQHDISE